MTYEAAIHAEDEALGPAGIALAGAEGRQGILALAEQAVGEGVVAALPSLPGSLQELRRGFLRLSGLEPVAAQALGPAARRRMRGGLEQHRSPGRKPG